MKHLHTTTTLILATLILATATAPTAWAQTPTCDALTGESKKVAEYILTSAHLYDCCDATIAECVKTSPECKLAVRIANFVCRRAGIGQERSTIERALEKRAMSMMPFAKTFKIDLSDAPVVGCTKSEVQIAVYLCTRCPFCSKLIPPLYKELTAGKLAGKAAMYLRYFPIKSHEHSVESNLALAAAARMGKAWEYLIHAYVHFDSFKLESLCAWAIDIGLDRTEFDRISHDPKTRDMLVEAKKEGMRNGVEATPTIFINGRRYHGDLDLETLIDVIEEESSD